MGENTRDWQDVADAIIAVEEHEPHSDPFWCCEEHRNEHQSRTKRAPSEPVVYDDNWDCNTRPLRPGHLSEQEVRE